MRNPPLKSVGALLLIASSTLLSACGPEQPVVPSDLPPEAPAYLDFWWQKGAGEAGQHAMVVIVKESGEQIRLTSVDLEKSTDGWKQLYRKPTSAPSAVAEDLNLNTDIYSQGESTLRGRIENELGGVAKYQMTASEKLTLANGRAIDVIIVGSAIVAIPQEVPAEKRARVFDSIVFAHAAALAAEKKEAKTTAYGASVHTVFQNLGWVSASTSPTALSVDELLSSSLAKAGNAESIFQALKLTSAQAAANNL